MQKLKKKKKNFLDIRRNEVNTQLDNKHIQPALVHGLNFKIFLNLPTTRHGERISNKIQTTK